MSLKSFVNDPAQYAAFQEQVDKWIDHNQRTMEPKRFGGIYE